MKLQTGEGYWFKHAETKVQFHALKGAPSEWARDRGATHSMLSERGGTRPAVLMATRIKVGVDEDAKGNIVWEMWPIINLEELTAESAQNTLWWYRNHWKNSGFKHLEALTEWKPL